MVREIDRHVEQRASVERRALGDLVKRLRESFPDVPDEEIAATVRERSAQFEAAPVRDFIPVLVERQARQDLRGRQSNAPSQ